MEDDLAWVSKALTLTDDEKKGLVLEDEAWTGNQHRNVFCLVGRILSTRAFNFEAFRYTMTMVLNPVRGMEMYKLDEGRFLIVFNHTLDRSRVLDGSPWSFEKHLIILESLDENVNPVEVPLDFCQFHVHIHDLPFRMKNRVAAEIIGNWMGKFIDVDMDRDKDYVFSSTMRIRVSLDTRLPLKRGMKIKNSTGEKEIIVCFTYERLPNFCYICGICTHLARSCPRQYDEGFVNPEPDFPYGPWLRASSGTRATGWSDNRASGGSDASRRPVFKSGVISPAVTGSRRIEPSSPTIVTEQIPDSQQITSSGNPTVSHSNSKTPNGTKEYPKTSPPRDGMGPSIFSPIPTSEAQNKQPTHLAQSTSSFHSSPVQTQTSMSSAFTDKPMVFSAEAQPSSSSGKRDMTGRRIIRVSGRRN